MDNQLAKKSRLKKQNVKIFQKQIEDKTYIMKGGYTSNGISSLLIYPSLSVDNGFESLLLINPMS